MKLIDLQTGYFAHPERPQATFPEIHAVTPDKTPVCGLAVQGDFEYQWCSRTLEWSYIDCTACEDKLQAMADHEKLGQQMLAKFV
jgi:hypothetical protein